MHYVEAIVDLWHNFDRDRKHIVCDEQVAVVCTANRTNFIELTIDGHGSHTFERNSQKEAKLGPLSLNLTKADIDPDSFFLSVFEVVAIANDVCAAIPRIGCKDVQTSQSLHLELNSTFYFFYIFSCFTLCMYYNIIFRWKLFYSNRVSLG